MQPEHYKPISEYAFISDCHSAALISRDGSIDWCCMPRFDSRPCFARLLDYQRGGFCLARQTDNASVTYRDYVGESLVIITKFHSQHGETHLYDFIAMRQGGRTAPHKQITRIVECVEGHVEFEFVISPRFDFGLLLPWLKHHDVNTFHAIGGSDALIIHSDAPLQLVGRHDLKAEFKLGTGQRKRLTVKYCDPAETETSSPVSPLEQCDSMLEETLSWWKNWASNLHYDGTDKRSILRSALTLKGLCDATTGAIVAAATSSLPEALGGRRNWDYRYSWIRDSAFSTEALSGIGFYNEAYYFRRFIERSSAGSAAALQTMFGPHGERRLTEIELDRLEGYCGSKPVRIGNDAFKQLQLDCYGILLNLTWQWHLRGKSPDDDYWRFIVDTVEYVCNTWRQPDNGIWESRGAPRHFVHSKVMCWAALDRGIKLSEECMRTAPIKRWRKERAAIRDAIESHGFDPHRNNLVQSFGARNLDSALLLAPMSGYIEYDDPRMVATCDAIIEELSVDGMLRRYELKEAPDGMSDEEGVFIACTFWLAECLARQGRLEEARAYFDKAVATRSDIGLFSEEYHCERKLMLGNFPQGLSHLSHITAALALQDAIGQSAATWRTNTRDLLRHKYAQ